MVICDNKPTPAWVSGLVRESHENLCLLVRDISNVVFFCSKSISDIYFPCSRKKQFQSLLTLIPEKRIGGYSRGLDSKCRGTLPVVILNYSKPAGNVSLHIQLTCRDVFCPFDSKVTCWYLIVWRLNCSWEIGYIFETMILDILRHQIGDVIILDSDLLVNCILVQVWDIHPQWQYLVVYMLMWHLSSKF